MKKSQACKNDCMDTIVSNTGNVSSLQGYAGVFRCGDSRNVVLREVYVMLLVILIVWAVSVEGNAADSVVKDERLDVTQLQLDRITEYNQLIEYFCSLPYLPNGIEIHPDFIRALILAESNGDYSAISSRNARGLTQIVYTTGKSAAERLIRNHHINVDRLEYVDTSRLEQLTSYDLHDPAINILLACSLISRYNHDYNGQLDLVVAAWNAGPGSIVDGRSPQYTETVHLIGKVNGLFRYFLQQHR